MERKRTYGFFIACMAVFLGWGVAQEEFETPSVVTEGLLEGGHCVAHELNLPPQGFHIAGSGFHIAGSGFHIAGSVGGLVVGDVEYVDPTGTYPPTIVPAATVPWTMETMGLPPLNHLLRGELGRDVAIVVADDFADGHYALPPELFSGPDLDGLRHLIDSGDLSHGALVMHHLNVAVAATNSYDLVMRTDPTFVWMERSTGFHLIVTALDMSGGSSGAITAQEVFGSLTHQLNEKLQELGQEFRLGGAVVNMSWVLLPCATVEEFIANRDSYTTLWDYLIGLGLDPDVDMADVLKVLGELDQWDLQSFLDTGRYAYDLDPLAFVGASGNFSMEYQMLPAQGENVVGVAVSPVLRDFPGRYSNVGDVYLPSEWFRLQELDEAGLLGPETEIAYAGTSYTAPLAALFLAEDMAGPRLCVSPTSGRPRLKTDPAGNLYPTPADLPLEVAAGNC